MALPFKNRLTSKKEIDSVFRDGKALKGTFLLAKYKPNSLPVARVAIIVSLRGAGGAVARNRVKRIISEAVRVNLNDIKRGVDIVFVIKTKVEESAVSKEVTEILKKGNLI